MFLQNLIHARARGKNGREEDSTDSLISQTDSKDERLLLERESVW